MISSDIDKPPLFFESDLVKPRDETRWNTSFEWWWIRKTLLAKFGEACMNISCHMPKRAGVNLEVVQVKIKRDCLADLLDLSNYQIICRHCNTNPRMRASTDCRPNGWEKIIESIHPIEFYKPNNMISEKINLKKLTAELKLDECDKELNEINLKKEIWLARRISTYNHTFISNAAKNDLFTDRETKYSGYLKKLNENEKNLQYWESYDDVNCAGVFGMTEGSIRSHLVNRFGGMSKTSKIYAALKTDYLKSDFLKAW